MDFINSNSIILTADVISLEKDEKGHIGIAIGGGAPLCSCLYVIQVFDGSPVDKDGRIRAGDELVAVNGISIKGYEKQTVAKLIKNTSISFNKLEYESSQSQTFDILFKKFKHRFLESVDTKTADSIGLSRAILCNDLLGRLVNKLESNAQFYKDLIKKSQEILKNNQHLRLAQNIFGSTFYEIAARESLSEQQNLFFAVGNCHKIFNQQQNPMINKVIVQLQIYAEKAIPDTKLSIKRYLNAKFEYLSFCLKLKELEDEEQNILSFLTNGEPTNYEMNLLTEGIQAGNYEYRIMLREREKSRENFIKQRKHVMVKIELLDEKHIRELALQLRTIIEALKNFHVKCRDQLHKMLSSVENNKSLEYEKVKKITLNLLDGNMAENECLLSID